MAIPVPATPVSPKVKAGAAWAVLASLLLSILSAITPDMLAVLGPWEPLAFGAVTVATYFLGAYQKADPLRDLGAAAQAQAEADAPDAGPKHLAE